MTGLNNLALMKTNRMKRHVITFMAVGLLVSTATINCLAQTASDLPPAVQDVVKLVKANLGEEVVLAHIRNTSAHYSLSADQIIYLHNQGVTQNEITALLNTEGGSPNTAPASLPLTAPSSPAPAPVPAPTPAPASSAQYARAPVVPPAPGAPAAPVAASFESFQAQRSPYGSWIDVPGYGLCWRPSVAAADSNWRPYCDQGHWVYTADGWFWQSDYPWGDIVFHYGRWYRADLGWVWVPGYDWAPAWVCWRRAEVYCGWAPLPPVAVFRPGIGLCYNGRLAVDVDFGLGVEMFTFVPYDRFWEHNLHVWLLPRERVELIYHRSVVLNGYRLDHGRFIVEGLGRERMAALTHHEIREEAVLHGGPRRHEEVERRFVRDERRDRHER